MFVKPQGHVLHVLVRVPLKSYTDAEYPHVGDYVDLGKVDPSRCAPRPRWRCMENLELFEGGRQLPDPAHRFDAHVAGFRHRPSPPTIRRWPM